MKQITSNKLKLDFANVKPHLNIVDIVYFILYVLLTYIGCNSSLNITNSSHSIFNKLPFITKLFLYLTPSLINYQVLIQIVFHWQVKFQNSVYANGYIKGCYNICNLDV